MLILVGTKLVINWTLWRVLEELSQQEQLVAKDLPAREQPAVSPAFRPASVREHSSVLHSQPRHS